jgi:outer membrane autotransporter protein
MKQMQRIIPLAAATALMLGTAHAQMRAPAQTPWYGELGYMWLTVKTDPGFKANPQAVRGVIGYNFHPYFAAEGMAAFGTSSDSDRGVDIKLRNSYGIFAKPKYDFGNVEVFARLGWEHHRVRASGSGIRADESDSGFAWGAGANYNFNPRTYVGVDYLRLRKQNDVKIDGVTVNLGYRF